MLRSYYLLLILFAVGSLSSCVSSRRYQEEVTAKNEAKTQAAQAEEARLKSEKELKTAQEKIEELETDFAELKEDHKLLQDRYNQQQRLNKDLQESYDKLLALNEKLKEDLASRKRELSEELSIKRRELERKERELREAEARLDRERKELEAMRDELAGKNANISDLEGDLAKRMKQIEDLQKKLAERDQATKALREKLLEALKVFKEAGDLDVEVRNGKVYVSLSQKLLFKPGSAKVDPRGLEALGKVAGVLNKNTDLSILVEGHTDSDGEASSNWELSTERALAVTQKLISDQVDPARITAAGRGEHSPKASNDSKEGKATNRRTEIILEPKLDEIMGILEK